MENCSFPQQHTHTVLLSFLLLSLISIKWKSWSRPLLEFSYEKKLLSRHLFTTDSGKKVTCKTPLSHSRVKASSIRGAQAPSTFHWIQNVAMKTLLIKTQHTENISLADTHVYYIDESYLLIYWDTKSLRWVSALNKTYSREWFEFSNGV